jgi:hypothetical protein
MLDAIVLIVLALPLVCAAVLTAACSRRRAQQHQANHGHHEQGALPGHEALEGCHTQSFFTWWHSGIWYVVHD